MDDSKIKSVMKRNSGVFLAFKCSDANVAIRTLLDKFTTADIDYMMVHCSVDPVDIAAFQFAGQDLPPKPLTAVMSAVNHYVCSSDMSRLAPETLVLQIKAMQELNILNNMRANIAEDKLADACEDQK